MNIYASYKNASGEHGASISSSVLAGIISLAVIMVLALVGLGLYAVRQKKLAERAIGLSNPFGNSLPDIQTVNICYRSQDMYKHFLLTRSLGYCPSVTWGPSGKDSGGAPQLKGARWFSYDELKKCTNNFSDTNEIGSGGYGKVYYGTPGLT